MLLSGAAVKQLGQRVDEYASMHGLQTSAVVVEVDTRDKMFTLYADKYLRETLGQSHEGFPRPVSLFLFAMPTTILGVEGACQGR